MARSLWTGAISFGMVTIPVRSTSAADTQDLAFHLLHKKDGARIKNRRWCPKEDEEVPSDEIVKGFEVEKGQYVILEDEDFEKLPLPSKHVIDITDFVEEDEIGPQYFERSYYLEPDELGAKGYQLLMEALGVRGMVAIGKIAFRQREHLCALRPADGVLLLQTLHYADEIRAAPKVSDARLTKRELDMAFSLIDLLTTEFEPKKYDNEYRDALMKVIKAKQKGEELVEEPEAEDRKVVDLMEALRASVEAATKKESPRASARLAERLACFRSTR